jgi:hypothetical protein
MVLFTSIYLRFFSIFPFTIFILAVEKKLFIPHIYNKKPRYANLIIAIWENNQFVRFRLTNWLYAWPLEKIKSLPLNTNPQMTPPAHKARCWNIQHKNIPFSESRMFRQFCVRPPSGVGSQSPSVCYLYLTPMGQAKSFGFFAISLC